MDCCADLLTDWLHPPTPTDRRPGHTAEETSHCLAVNSPQLGLLPARLRLPGLHLCPQSLAQGQALQVPSRTFQRLSLGFGSCLRRVSFLKKF